MHVKNFPSGRIKCMQDYITPSFRENLHHLIISVGTNDISTNKQSKQIAKSIAELALSVKTNSCGVASDIRYQIYVISDITGRNNSHQRKVVETNWHLK